MSTITPEITEVKRSVETRFGGSIRDLGVFNCRRVRDLSGNVGEAWSQHAWGNAWDVGGPPSTLRAVVDHVRSSGLPHGSIITYGYTGGHVHIEGPKRRGTPPCAGGTGDEFAPPGQAPEDAGRAAGARRALAAITSGQGWRRVGWGAAGVVLILAGGVLVGVETRAGRAVVEAAATRGVSVAT